MARRGSVAVAWPAAGAATVLPPARGAAAGGTPLAAAGSLPIRVGRPAPGGSTRTPAAAGDAPVRVEVLDRAATDRAGVRGVLLRIGHPDGVARRTVVEVDYSGFRDAFGGDYASRLALVQLPETAASAGSTAATGPGSATSGVAVPSTNNVRAGRLTAEVSDGLFGVSAAPSGSSGSFQPTSLAPSATWQVGLQSGDFNWSYPMNVPGMPGPAPSIGLSYSSGGVDGREAATNNQPSWVGEGFDLPMGFIERSYRSCGEDGQAATVLDLCWASDNATVSLPGMTGALVRDDATGVWRAEHDQGWRVELVTGATNGDDNGEHWKLTSPDGTQYFFGLNRLPQWQAGKPETNSTWTVPVFGNQTGEPCHASTFAASSCAQGYRWNLDYVVDRHGDAMTLWYDRETNTYARSGGTPTSYIRGGYLNRIEYGQRASALWTTPASARVAFTVADRCVPGTACVQSQPKDWPDTPWDQSCGAGTCVVTAPTFWTTKRLSRVATQIFTGGSYQDVESWTLSQSYPVPTDGTSPALWLDSIVHTGHVGGTLSTPPVTFDGTPKANRVDPADARPAMYKRRIQNIYTETGGQISVSYSEQQCLPASLPTVDNNDRRCFPAMWGATTSLSQDFFNKYVVTQTTSIDLVGGSPDQVNTYEYVPGGHSWRHDDVEVLSSARKSWAQWRGYQTVRVRSGPPGGIQTLAEHVFLRGMDGDVNRSGSPDAVVVDGLADLPVWAGFPRSTTEYDMAGGAWLTRTTSVPVTIRRTAVRARTGMPPLEAYLADEKTEQSQTALDGGGVRTTETTRRYDPTYGTLESLEDRGDLSTPDDDACTRYTYVRNLTDWIVDTESRTEVIGVPCDATPSYPNDLISDERSFYDGSTTWGAIPTAGDATRVQEASSWSGGPVYADSSRTVLDAHGRTIEEYDALGNKSTTAYTPVLGGPVTEVRGTNALGHTTTVTLHPMLGDPVKSVDANGRITETAYDALGRVSRVWAPGRSRATQSPTVEFGYTVRTDGPSAVATRSLLGNGTGYLTSYTLLDGLLRPRQTQQPSPAGGRILTDTGYDAYGRTGRTNAAYWDNTGPPGTTLVAVADAAIPGQTRHVYDGAGRETAKIFMSSGVEKWRTTMAYGGNWTSVDPPDGDTATMSITDADGRITERRQFTGGAPSGAYDTTRYTYAQDGQVSTVTDPVGNVWRHFYDLRGREIRTDDPDSGTSTSGFDDEDRLTSVTDSRGHTLAYTYDALGRKTGMFDGSTAGTKLADWTFDTLPGGIGMAAARTRYVGADAYRSEVLGYDAAGRPTGSALTIPAAETGLVGRYETRIGYNAASQVTSTLLPAMGDVPAETVQYGYDANLGLPTTLRSAAATYVNASAYTELGEPAGLTLGAGGAQVLRDFAYQPGTRRIASVQTRTRNAGTDTTVSSIGYTYDPAGNLTELVDSTVSDRQCFRYDYLRRLVDAWTPAAGCAAAPAVAGLGGPAAYWHRYDYDKVGNRTSEVQHAAAGDTTRAYTYPAPGAAQPHTLRSVATTGPGGPRTDTYGYDTDGNTTARPGQSLAWDAEGHLASVAVGASTTSFLYDADGNRLIRRDATGTTLYLGDTELRRTGSGTLTGTRYYSHGGSVVGVRTAGKLSWLVPDHHGTGQLAIDSGTLTVSRRYLLPFGAPRGPAPAGWPGEKGFVGGTSDPTGLTHLGAREYDPATGRFISVDPVIDADDPQQMNGYAYANNSPATFTDPDGLQAACGNPAQCDHAAEEARRKQEEARRKQEADERKAAAKAIAAKRLAEAKKKEIRDRETAANLKKANAAAAAKHKAEAKRDRIRGQNQAAPHRAPAKKAENAKSDKPKSVSGHLKELGDLLDGGVTAAEKTYARRVLSDVKLTDKEAKLLREILGKDTPALNKVAKDVTKASSPLLRRMGKVMPPVGAFLTYTNSRQDGDSWDQAAFKTIAATSLGMTWGAAGALCGPAAAICTPTFSMAGSNFGEYAAGEFLKDPEYWSFQYSVTT